MNEGFSQVTKALVRNICSQDQITKQLPGSKGLRSHSPLRTVPCSLRIYCEPDFVLTGSDTRRPLNLRFHHPSSFHGCVQEDTHLWSGTCQVLKQ